MESYRLEAFSDGVLAIIITIMVLELKVPHGSDMVALKPLLPVFLRYVLSFIYLGIYWNNHQMKLEEMGQRAIQSLRGLLTMWLGIEQRIRHANTQLFGLLRGSESNLRAGSSAVRFLRLVSTQSSNRWGAAEASGLEGVVWDGV